MIKINSRVRVEGEPGRGTVMRIQGNIASVKWDNLPRHPALLIQIDLLELVTGMEPNDRYPTYSARTCDLLMIPIHWAGVPMNACRFRTILANK